MSPYIISISTTVGHIILFTWLYIAASMWMLSGEPQHATQKFQTLSLLPLSYLHATSLAFFDPDLPGSSPLLMSPHVFLPRATSLSIQSG